MENPTPQITHPEAPDKMREDVCEHCAFSVFQETGPVGQCRANPPTPLIVPQQQQQRDITSGRMVQVVVPVVQCVFPPVERRDYCFTFEPRTDEITD